MAVKHIEMDEGYVPIVIDTAESLREEKHFHVRVLRSGGQFDTSLNKTSPHSDCKALVSEERR